MEKSLKVFPLRGKNGPVFPQCGKYFSIAWKNREKVFHTVENLPGFKSKGLWFFVIRFPVINNIMDIIVYRPRRDNHLINAKYEVGH